jgi:hypothetical protein
MPREASVSAGALLVGTTRLQRRLKTRSASDTQRSADPSSSARPAPLQRSGFLYSASASARRLTPSPVLRGLGVLAESDGPTSLTHPLPAPSPAPGEAGPRWWLEYLLLSALWHALTMVRSHNRNGRSQWPSRVREVIENIEPVNSNPGYPTPTVGGPGAPSCYRVSLLSGSLEVTARLKSVDDLELLVKVLEANKALFAKADRLAAEVLTLTHELGGSAPSHNLVGRTGLP